MILKGLSCEIINIYSLDLWLDQATKANVTTNHLCFIPNIFPGLPEAKFLVILCTCNFDLRSCHLRLTLGHPVHI